MTAISVSGLRKTYGDNVAVDGVDLEVAAGEIVAVLGPNGAGKTTTIEILEGYRRADAGEVSVLGVDPAAGDEGWRARLGIVPQETGAFTGLKVAEAVGHLARFFPEPLPVAEALRLVDIEDLADRRIDQLSGGQQRRVDVACGLVGRPEILFLDEPTTGLDPAARRRMWEVVDGVRSQGTTVVLTTHYLEEAEALADRVVVLAAGRVVAAGTPTSIGGRADGRATVTFRPAGPLGDVADQLPEGSSVDVSGELATVITGRPAAAVAALIAAGLASADGELEGLTISRPSLEDVYLQLVGEAGQP